MTVNFVNADINKERLKQRGETLENYKNSCTVIKYNHNNNI